MKISSILAGVLALMGGRAYAADFADLQSFKVPDVKTAMVQAVVPPSKAGGTGYAALDRDSRPVMALNIKVKDGIKLSAKGIYLSSSDSLSCTHVSFSDGSMQRLPNIVEKNIAVNVSGEANVIKVDRGLNDNCRSQLNGLSINAFHSKIVPEFNRIDVLQSDADHGMLVQKIAFKKIESPYLGVVFVSADAKILVGPNGVANAEVSLQK